jgi:tyrosine-protein phosphatase SIW14
VAFQRISAATLALIAAILISVIGCTAPYKLTSSRPAFAEKTQVSGIPDFGKVSDFLYRGGQPQDDGLEELKRRHIDTIVDLRGELHGLVEHERQHAQALGMRLVNLPGSGWATPKDEEIAQFFDLILERPRRTIFIHCWLGGDRSGEFVAAYRIAFDGWSPQQAIEEMRKFHYLHFWHPNMARWVEKFPDRLAQSPKLASFRRIQTQR